ncbi:hypothetical protein BN7_4506 [Wickerhamomyces ciferrii]|uniref:Uncharacterized protein n=1 Tax=Wickerhamomyces ciferrii (strain ATCC 14091 / BCRC 22168 / CBS 111 / JCM 3599 / NBRC 0793 / NRRL Y-1031 F-60-10) TaxID=1206466 RepID=K0KPL4_WICCF|nr:uncharacterized protein BN7_4506 [Wickerhamomyces ciferrii]CCH44936.1 hypothetical protein BN7_4506 [Wickerhamomyces ciferrii]
MMQQQQRPNTTEFRRYPKNTWRLTKLQQRYVQLKNEEESKEDLITYSRSEQELRKHLLNNFSFIANGDLNLNNSNQSTETFEQDKHSLSSIPSLISANTSSPSLSFQSNFNEDDHQPQLVSEHLEKYQG